MPGTHRAAASAGVTADATLMNTAGPEATPETVRLGLQLGGRHYMVLKAKIDATKPEAEVIKEIRQEHHIAMAEFRRWCIPPCRFVEPVVLLGTLPMGWEHNISVEMGNTCHEVVFSNPVRDPTLTAAFFRPNILSSATPFAEKYRHVTTASTETKTVIVALRVKEGAVAALVATWMAVAVLVSLVGGIGTGDIRVGLACFAGIAAVPSVLLPLLHWTTNK